MTQNLKCDWGSIKTVKPSFFKMPFCGMPKCQMSCKGRVTQRRTTLSTMIAKQNVNYEKLSLMQIVGWNAKCHGRRAT